MVNKELKFVKWWLDVNRLSLNISKTNYITFHSTTMKNPEDTSIRIGRKRLTKAKYVKFLGLLLDENLSWKFHLSELSKGPVTRSDIRKRSNQIMKEKNILRVSFAYLIV